MNYAIVFRLLGYVLMIEGALLLLPAAASGFHGGWFVLMLAPGGGQRRHRLRPARHQAPKQGILYAGGLCCYLAELDRHFHRGCRSVCGDGLHPEPGGRPV